jgi:hypothetical protein
MAKQKETIFIIVGFQTHCPFVNLQQFLVIKIMQKCFTVTSLGILGKHHEVGVAYDSKVTFCCGKVSLAKRERS